MRRAGKILVTDVTGCKVWDVRTSPTAAISSAFTSCSSTLERQYELRPFVEPPDRSANDCTACEVYWYVKQELELEEPAAEVIVWRGVTRLRTEFRQKKR